MHEHNNVERLIALFNRTFSAYNTRLIKGEGEPVYIPANETVPYHRIEFAHGFFASALHEVAHWCIAGASRRLLEDYGYWYCPDGRDHLQQKAFESVEIKPQALEWAFSLASGQPFRVSTDNLDGAEPDRETFTSNVKSQLLTYMAEGFPPRAAIFIRALETEFNRPQIGEHSLMECAA
ncbi:elongation factor P hydroxylase [Alteromonas sediminis]|uniref:Elongation factor P hydroxylase n=1 Tax=Alteromonas sediminis TaxID=2259342 RepID=A0A3N5XWM7_9ALTE|nr:elongation factor P hydroxylase [Alteromonas sediminis]RPJ65102.1 elongation factor P hydroxylase [Alteromonas sediminis]